MSAATETKVVHPPGMRTLFLTEMWERMSYYGMRALLVLFMVSPVERGGMGLDAGEATAVYGLYTALVYLAALPGGWVGDRLLGTRDGVWWGGVVIALGHLVLGFDHPKGFYVGLVLVALGSGLLKSNMSTLVGALYPEGGARRDAGFTLFYMGVNVGAFLGPMVCSALGEKLGWRWGFSAAGMGMVFGLIQFRWSRERLGNAGELPSSVRADWRALRGRWVGLVCAVIAMVATGVALWTGWLTVDPKVLASRTAGVIAGVGIVYFLWAALEIRLAAKGGPEGGVELRRLGVIAVLFAASALFWSGFEQVGSSLSLFAERFTDRMVLEWQVPAGWFQSVNALFVIVLAPLMAGLWTAWDRRGGAPGLAAKVAWSLVLLGAGFLVAAWAARRADASGTVGPLWLVTVYFIHTVGELCLSPVGLSAVTKLAPQRLAGQMMGVWFVGSALGNVLAGMLAGEVAGEGTLVMSARFMEVVRTAGIAAVVMLVLIRPLNRWMGGVR
jgi:POT family proton-dependent oligopeptide transporter